MKTKYKLFALLSAMLPLAITGCSNNEESTPAVEVPELVVAEKEVKVKIGDDISVDITQGGDQYKVFSLNKEVAEAQLANNKLTVQGVKIGKTSLIISDDNNSYQRLAVSVYQYEAVKIEQQEIALKFPQGHSRTITVNILEGNGDYTVSSDSKVVEASVNGSRITLKALGQNGVANITVTDASDFKAVISVQTTASTTPYEEAELEAMKEDETLRYVFNENVIRNANVNASYSILNKKEGELNLYGWDYFNFYFLKVYFAGDKTIGEKTEGKLTFKEAGSSFSNEPIKFEIIKNDGMKIWATYSFIKNEKLNFGHFCQSINP